MNFPPFELKHELYNKLGITNDRLYRTSLTPSSSNSTTVAIPQAAEHLPGQPGINLNDHSKTSAHLQREFLTERLDKFQPHLWLVAKPDSTHISSLTEQVVRGRQIVISEDPGLHLVWVHDRVFLKPIPKYMFSHAFWSFYLTGNRSPIADIERQRILRAATGFMRTYVYLVQHKSDYLLAKNEEHRLVPKGISFSKFTRFIEAFRVDDSMVSPRYRFGQLRLTRLNFWIKVLFFQFTYMKVYGQYSAYAARFYGPLLFGFAVFSVLLAAMQVCLASLPAQPSRFWNVLIPIARWFSVVTLVVVVLVTLFLVLVIAILGLRETIFAVRKMWWSKASDASRCLDRGGEGQS